MLGKLVFPSAIREVFGGGPRFTWEGPASPEAFRESLSARGEFGFVWDDGTLNIYRKLTLVFNGMDTEFRGEYRAKPGGDGTTVTGSFKSSGVALIPAFGIIIVALVAPQLAGFGFYGIFASFFMFHCGGLLLRIFLVTASPWEDRVKAAIQTALRGAAQPPSKKAM